MLDSLSSHLLADPISRPSKTKNRRCSFRSLPSKVTSCRVCRSCIFCSHLEADGTSLTKTHVMRIALQTLFLTRQRSLPPQTGMFRCGYPGERRVHRLPFQLDISLDATLSGRNSWASHLSLNQGRSITMPTSSTLGLPLPSSLAETSLLGL